MTILITGATGRVGRELLASRRAAGENVRALVLPGDPAREELESEDVEIVTGSLTDREAVRKAVAGVDRVAHLAAVMLWDRESDRDLFEQNIAGTFNLLEAVAAREPGVERFFLASSDEVYPSLKASRIPIDELHPTNPYSFYGLTKETNERFAFFYYRAYGVPVTVARFALVARSEEILRPDGWSGRFLFVAPMQALFAALGRPDATVVLEAACRTDPSSTLLLALDEKGAPYVFHMCDVLDVVTGINLMLSNPNAIGQVFNLSGPEPFDYRTAVDALRSATGLPHVEVRIPGAPIRISHDISKARNMLGYEPEHDIRKIVANATAGSAER